MIDARIFESYNPEKFIISHKKTDPKFGTVSPILLLSALFFFKFLNPNEIPSLLVNHF